MFFTVAGVPAGYGYFTTPSVANENIMPALTAHIKANDPNKNINPVVHVGTMSIEVETQCNIRVNERAPILVKPETGLSFDARNVYSLVFVEGGINYNIAVSY